MINDLFSVVFMFVGFIFMLIVSIGMVKFLDFYICNFVSIKVVVLGVLLILLGVGIYYNDMMIFIEIFVIFLFIFLIVFLVVYIVFCVVVIMEVGFWEKIGFSEFEDYKKE